MTRDSTYTTTDSRFTDGRVVSSIRLGAGMARQRPVEIIDDGSALTIFR